MQAIGLLRFSYPAIGGFQVHHDTAEARMRYLYAPERMEERFRLFETVALPSLCNQTDQDFDVIIVIGDAMPEPYLSRLQSLVAGVPQVQIQAHPPIRHRVLMKEILQKARRNPGEPCLQFRHDDDDAVSLDFIERLRGVAVGCAALTEIYPTVAFDFSRGYLARLDASGVSAIETVRSCNVAGLAMQIAGRRQTSIMNFAHNKIPNHMPVVSIPDVPMWVRTLNTYNDSRQKPVKPIETTALTVEEEADFQMRFGINSDLVRQAYQPHPTGRPRDRA